MRRPSQSPPGFSLIELLVVMAIMGLMVSLINLSVGGSDGRRDALQDAATSLAGMMSIASSSAILRGEPIGMHWYAPDAMAQTGWRLDWSRWINGQWRKEAVRDLPEGVLPAGIEPMLEVEGGPVSLERAAELPVLVFYPTGETTLFRLQLSMDTGDRVVIDNMRTGAIELAP